MATISLLCGGVAHAQDMAKQVQHAAKLSTLDQKGTKPFHLEATLTSTSQSDRASNQTGEVEIWWVSPERWRREVRSPEFKQVQIVDGAHVWQKNDGDFFPEWLRNLAIELVDPVPPLDHVVERVKTADVRSLMGQTHAQWMNMGSDGTVSKGIGAGIALKQDTGLILYGSEVGWNGAFADYSDFHGLKVARKVNAAIVTVLEDLPAGLPNDFFDASATGGDAHLLSTVVVDEPMLRKNLLPVTQVTWPALANGPLEGAMITEITVDRDGAVRSVGTVVSDNPGLNDAARDWISKIKFRPYLVNGEPVQVVSTLTLPFKTTRPAGSESFDSARTYFERGRELGFLAAKDDSGYCASCGVRN
jgi:Gram-negative bacterial TonB protein C-terminal